MRPWQYVTILFALWMFFGVTTHPSGAAENTTPETNNLTRALPLALSGEEAARTMQLPVGFQATLFAGEPAVKQPVGFCLDDRGRLWVAEAYNYPQRGKAAGDRIIILEDIDHDGKFDRRQVFYDQLNYVTGIEVGFGGVWIMSPPALYFIPDKNRDDRPDGPAQILLDGFGNHANAHNLANGFAWGPDGWLYGTHGRTNWSMIGKPGMPQDQRVRFDGGVYRYHPIGQVWEAFADGTTNPWGIDWDEYGEAFVCNCVTPHLFHVIPGAHYEPWRNRRSSQYAYQRIDTIADHLHYGGGANVRAGIGSALEDSLGGGHAHCGTMIYLGDNWPAEYRGNIFLNNIHGRRINQDRLVPRGSGYVATHAADLMRSKDPWFMGVTLAYGPDGGVFVSDWSDTGECHSITNTQRQTGRIYKIFYGQPRQEEIDVAALSQSQLVALHTHQNEWFVRHARRVLQERHATSQDLSVAKSALQLMLAAAPQVQQKLRALWSLHVCEGIAPGQLLQLMSHTSPHLRAWAIRLLCETGAPSEEALAQMTQLATEDPSPRVRLALAAALQRLPWQDRWTLGERLAGHEEDASDANLPLMIWYGWEPLVESDLGRFCELATQSKLPSLRRHIARRALESSEEQAALNHLLQQLGSTKQTAVANDLLQGSLRALAGSRQVAMPATWPQVYSHLIQLPNESLQKRLLRLALLFRDPQAERKLLGWVNDSNQTAKKRAWAIGALVSIQSENLGPTLLTLLPDPSLQAVVLQGLAQYQTAGTAVAIRECYSTLSYANRQLALQTLATRTPWAHVLLDGLETGDIPRSDVTAFTARQLRLLGQADLVDRVNRLWGELRATPAEKIKLIAKYQQQLTPSSLATGDQAAGRKLFLQHCATCHQLHGEGKSVGPDITGAQRSNLDYLLENIIDPSATVSKDFQMQVIVTDDGRTLSGLVAEETGNGLTLLTTQGAQVIPITEILSRNVSQVSMMPAGLLSNLSKGQVRDLISYLQSAQR